MLKNMLSGGISLMQSTTLLFNLKVASSNNQWALGSIPLLVMVKIHPFGELVGSDLPPPPPPNPPKKKMPSLGFLLSPNIRRLLLLFVGIKNMNHWTLA